MSDRADRRRNNRQKVKRMVQLEIQNGSEEVHTILAEMDSLSPRGLSVVTASRISEQAQEFTLRIPLPDKKVMLEATVERIWQLVDEKKLENKYGFIFTKLRT